MYYLHEFLFLLLTRADGVPDGADLREDGLCLLQLVAIRAVGDLLVDPGDQRGETRKKGTLETVLLFPQHGIKIRSSKK